jgi:hypothetical protein
LVCPCRHPLPRRGRGTRGQYGLVLDRWTYQLRQVARAGVGPFQVCTGSPTRPRGEHNVAEHIRVTGGSCSEVSPVPAPNTYEAPRCQETNSPYERILPMFFRWAAGQAPSVSGNVFRLDCRLLVRHVTAPNTS